MDLETFPLALQIRAPLFMCREPDAIDNMTEALPFAPDPGDSLIYKNAGEGVLTLRAGYNGETTLEGNEAVELQAGEALGLTCGGSGWLFTSRYQ